MIALWSESDKGRLLPPLLGEFAFDGSDVAAEAVGAEVFEAAVAAFG